jgi:iron(III) transport system ATP-binding protein
LKVQVDGGRIKAPDGSSIEYKNMPSDELKSEGEIVLASRPSEIDFVSENGIAGTVKRKSFLGEIVDYAVDIAGTEIRVQKGRKFKGPNAGEACRLDFLHPRWYSVKD